VNNIYRVNREFESDNLYDLVCDGILVRDSRTFYVMCLACYGERLIEDTYNMTIGRCVACDAVGYVPAYPEETDG